MDKSTGECVVPQQLGHNEQHQATIPLLANLYVCEGEPGTVIKVCAKKRTGKLDFIASMQKALGNHYKDELVGKFILNYIVKNCIIELDHSIEMQGIILNCSELSACKLRLGWYVHYEEWEDKTTRYARLLRYSIEH